MKIARDGIAPVIFLLLCALAFAFVSVIPAAIIFVLALFVIWFFRDRKGIQTIRTECFILLLTERL